jgi:ketosteroid isomerase-like protein
MKKKVIIITLLFAICTVVFNSCNTTDQSPNTANLEEAKKAIAESNDIYFQAFVKNDSSIFINRYAEDCCIMGPNAPAMCGANAALEFFKIAYNEFGLRNGKFITQEVFGVGDGYVAEVGLWQSFDANNTLVDDGKFLVLWKKTPKGWKMFRDSFSSNRAFEVNSQ